MMPDPQGGSAEGMDVSDSLNCQRAEQTLGGSPSVLREGVTALHRAYLFRRRLLSRLLTISQRLRPSQESRPFQTFRLSRLLTISKLSMLSKGSGAPIQNSFTDPRLLTLLRRIGAPHRGTSASDLSALSASDDFKSVDALIVVRCPNPEQFHGRGC
jgi:hypothetical protein